MTTKEYIEKIYELNEYYNERIFLPEEDKSSLDELIELGISDESNRRLLANSRIGNLLNNLNSTKIANAVESLKGSINTQDELGGLAHKLIMVTKKNSDASFDTKNKIISMLLENGLNPNLKDDMGNTYIDAAIFGRPKVPDILLGGFMIPVSLSQETSFKVILDLINDAKKYGFDVNTKNNYGNSLIHTAIISPYFKGNILLLLNALGEEFDINVRNNDGQDIIDYLNYCLTNDEAYADYEDKVAVSRHKDYLERNKDEIIDYIKIRRNPSMKDQSNNTSLKNKLASLNKQIAVNERMAIFIGNPIQKPEFDIEKITSSKLNTLIKSQLNLTRELANNVINIAKIKFGELYKFICQFVMLGKEDIKLGIGKYHTDIKFSIEQAGLLLKYKKDYPAESTINEKIKWLHDAIIEHDLKKEKIATAKARARARM